MEKRLIVAAETVKVDEASPIKLRKLHLNVAPRWNGVRLAGHHQIAPVIIGAARAIRRLGLGEHVWHQSRRLDGCHRSGQRRRHHEVLAWAGYCLGTTCRRSV